MKTQIICFSVCLAASILPAAMLSQIQPPAALAAVSIHASNHLIESAPARQDIRHGALSPRTVASAIVTSTNAYTTYLPLVLSKPALELHGTITFQGEPASGVGVTLYKCCRDPWYFGDRGYDFIGSTTTDENGVYNFRNVPSLSASEYKSYLVEYVNNYLPDPTRLGYWRTRDLTTYENGSTVSLGTFDISTFALIEPTAGITVSMPITFRWVMRPIVSDTYGLVIWSTVKPSAFAYYSDLSHGDNHTLYSCQASNLNPGFWYSWGVKVAGPDGGYGYSFERRGIVCSE